MSRAPAVVRDLDHTVALAVARELNLALGRACNHARDLVHALAPRELGYVLILGATRAEERALDLDYVLARANVLAHDLANALDLARVGELVVVLGRAHEIAHDLANDLNHALGRTSAGVVQLARATANQLAALSGRGADLARVVQTHGTPSQADTIAARHSVLAAQLLGHAMGLVPVAHRKRYDEEFRGELDQIAQARGRWAQLGYALRVARQVWTLRLALRGVPPEAPERIGAG